MVDVNWDDVAQEADDSPRSLLAQALSQADDIDSVVIIKRMKESDLVTFSASTKSAVETAGLLAFGTRMVFDPDVERPE